MRIIKHEKDKPFVIKLSDVPGLKEKAEKSGLGSVELHICACGLSKHKPFCDGSHRHVQGEESGKVFAYKEDGTRIALTEEDIRNIIDELPNEY